MTENGDLSHAGDAGALGDGNGLGGAEMGAGGPLRGMPDGVRVGQGSFGTGVKRPCPVCGRPTGLRWFKNMPSNEGSVSMHNDRRPFGIRREYGLGGPAPCPGIGMRVPIEATP